MIQAGLIIASLTELKEQWIWVGVFFLSPSRLYILAVLFMAFLNHFWCARTGNTGQETKTYSLSVLLVLGLNIISAVESPDLAYSVKRVLNATSLYLLPILICFYLRANQSRQDWSDLLPTTGKTLSLVGFGVALFGIVQSGTGWLQHSSELRPLLGIPFRRINSVFPDPNFLAYFLVFPLWIVLAGGEAATKIKSSTFRWMIIAVILFAIVLTGSRGGQLMIVAATFSHLLFRLFKYRPKLIMVIECTLVVVFPLVLILISVFGFEYLWSRVGAFDSSTESAFSRVLSWYAGIKIYLESPWFGVGPGNFVTMNKGIYLPYNYVPPWVAINISTLAGHSNVVEGLVETGPFGLAAYFGMQFVVYRALLRAQALRPQFAIYRSLYFSAALGSTLITYYPIFLMILIGVLLYLVDAMPVSKTVSKDRHDLSAPIRRAQLSGRT